MCGIAGIMTTAGAPPVEFSELQAMISMLTHRGPDGYGLFRDERVGLAHSRLSIIDFAGGAQPLCSRDGAVWLSFNGEIFNYVELRDQLTALGHRFSTSGDTEVIIQCYERFGSRTWKMLNGQFAFALWDSRRRKLWLVRDRLGILPLHYTRLSNHLLFASEAKAIFASGRIQPRFDRSALGQVFTTWSAQAPCTVFEHVREVLPATALCFDDQLRPWEQQYWRLDPVRRPTSMSASDAAERLEAHLARSVALRLRADVPVGAYLSGGLDSSVIGSLAAARSDRLETFGIRFENPQFDETKEQRLVARHLGTNHHEIFCTASSIRAAVADTVWHCETPLLRTSPVPLYLLSAKVKAAGIKTVLTGEGADELLCGYTIFKEDRIRRFWARRPDSHLRPALMQRIHHYVGGAEARSNELWKSFFGRGLLDTDHPFYSHMVRWRNTAWALRLLSPGVRESFSFETMLQEMQTRLPNDWSDWDPLDKAQYTEIQGFMSSYLLSCQGDRVAMANGVEARYPYLDPEVVDFCFTLERAAKLIGTRDKIALRRVAQRHIPQEIWSRPKKPFRAPIGSTFFDVAGAEETSDLLSPTELARDDVFDVPIVARLLDRTRKLAGRSLGEREEMGLAGILTLKLLSDSYFRQFSHRMRDAQRRLAKLPCHVLVDRASDNNIRHQRVAAIFESRLN